MSLLKKIVLDRWMEAQRKLSKESSDHPDIQEFRIYDNIKAATKDKNCPR